MSNFTQQGEVCHLNGRLTAQQVVTLWPQRHSLVSNDTKTLDLSKLEYSDSAGIAFLIELLGHQEKIQSEFGLSRPSKQVQKLISLYDLDVFFTK